MDTSKEYIKMCEKAVEMQKLWNWRISPVGDYCWLGDEYLECAIFICTMPMIQLEGRIWLPRQDQLQDMVDNNTLAWNLMVFYDWTNTNHSLISPNDCRYQKINSAYYTSMEQLWLAFVMKEKYNKVWDGNDWRCG